MNEAPDESPYNNIGSIANPKDSWMQTVKGQSKQQTRSPSNQATAGSWGTEDPAGPTKGTTNKV